MAEAAITTNVVLFPTPALPTIEKTPELAIILSIFCALPADVRASAMSNLERLRERGDRFGAAALQLLAP